LFARVLHVRGGPLGPADGEHGIVLVSPGLDPGAEHVLRAAEGVAVVVPAGADARAPRERADLVSRALALHGNALGIDRDHAAGGEGAAAADGDALADVELLGHAG
jgi:hypothetical protein